MPERYLGTYLGRFRVDHVVGSGGFSWVYRGYDPELDIPVAIKVLKPQFAGDETFEERFRREASTAAKLRHPNIIRILAVGREGGAVYFVMDYLPHGLVERLRIMGTFPDTLLVRLGLDVAAALSFAHREGVIHRDIKTDNIMFDEHGNAIVADFGIARAVSGYVQQTGTNMVVGTPQYFSPEQARGQPLDGRSDIYALGVTLFRAATGVLPFEGEDWYEVARRHIEEPPPKPRSFNTSISRGVERVILKCLEKDPGNRFPTAEALQDELSRLNVPATATGERTVIMSTPTEPQRTLTPTAPIYPWWHVSRRALGVLGLGAAAAVALGVGIARRGTVDAAPAAADSALVASLRRADATGPAGATTPAPTDTGASGHGSLRVRAPSTALISLNGRRLGKGTLLTDTLTEGRYMVSALLPSIDGCPSVRDSARVTVRAADTANVTLRPRPCGWLSLDGQPRGARFVVRTTDGARQAQGSIPSTHPLPMPVGTYQLLISAPNCADFIGDLTIKPARMSRERIRLICRS